MRTKILSWNLDTTLLTKKSPLIIGSSVHIYALYTLGIGWRTIKEDIYDD